MCGVSNDFMIESACVDFKQKYEDLFIVSDNTETQELDKLRRLNVKVENGELGFSETLVDYFRGDRGCYVNVAPFGRECEIEFIRNYDINVGVYPSAGF